MLAYLDVVTVMSIALVAILPLLATLRAGRPGAAPPPAAGP
jgi:hypothetical protein